MSEQAKKSPFYDFLSRYAEGDFESDMAGATQDEDYLNWHGYCRCREIREVDVVQQGLSLVDHLEERDLIRYCGETGTAVVTYEPLGSGILTGQSRPIPIRSRSGVRTSPSGASTSACSHPEGSNAASRS